MPSAVTLTRGAVAAALLITAVQITAVSPGVAPARPAPRGEPVQVPPPVSGRTLTVGPDGQYRSVQDAADAARPGDNVAIAPGTYDGGLRIGRDGEAGRYITFYGDGGTARITGDSGGEGLVELGGHSHLRLVNITSAGSDGFGAHASGGDDLVFRNFGVAGSQDGGLVLLDSSNILVDGCDISGTNARGTSADHEALTVGAGSSGIEVTHCAVHDNGEEGIDVKYDDDARARIHDNVVTGNRGPNIYVDSSSGVQVYANTVSGTRNGTKAGIGLAVEDYSDSRRLSDIQVYDNVSYGNAQSGLSFWVESAGTIADVRIVNNTFAGNAGDSVSFDGGTFEGTNLLRNNIFGDGAVRHEGFATDHNATGDPGFADAAGGDFRLTADSAAVDAGSADGAPALDRDGTARPRGAGFDIGAYER